MLETNFDLFLKLFLLERRQISWNMCHLVLEELVWSKHSKDLKSHFIILRVKDETEMFPNWILLCMKKQEIKDNISWEFNEGWEPDRTGANDKAKKISNMVLN